jgi:hypothetical protein
MKKVEGEKLNFFKKFFKNFFLGNVLLEVVPQDRILLRRLSSRGFSA